MENKEGNMGNSNIESKTKAAAISSADASAAPPAVPPAAPTAAPRPTFSSPAGMIQTKLVPKVRDSVLMDKTVLKKSETRSNINPEVQQERTFLDTCLQTSFKYITLSSQETKLNEFLCLKESPSCVIINSRKELKSLLLLRKINKSHLIVSNRRLNMELVEIFLFKTKRKIKKISSERSKEINVLYNLPIFKKNGLYYVYLSEKTENENEDFLQLDRENQTENFIKDILPHDIMNISCIGSRERLEMFIVNFAEMISERFRKYLKIERQSKLQIEDGKNEVFAEKEFFYEEGNYLAIDPYEKRTAYVKCSSTESEPGYSCESPDSGITAVEEKNNLDADDIDSYDEDFYAIVAAAASDDDEGYGDFDYNDYAEYWVPVKNVDKSSTVNMEVIPPDGSPTENSVSFVEPSSDKKVDDEKISHDDIPSCSEMEAESSAVPPVYDIPSSSEVEDRSTNRQPSKKMYVSFIDLSSEAEFKPTNVSLADHILSISEVEEKQSNVPTTEYAVLANDCLPSNSGGEHEPFNLLACENQECSEIPSNSGNGSSTRSGEQLSYKKDVSYSVKEGQFAPSTAIEDTSSDENLSSQMPSEYAPVQSTAFIGITTVLDNSLYIETVDQNQLSLISTAGYTSFYGINPVSNENSFCENQMVETNKQNSEHIQLTSSAGCSSHFVEPRFSTESNRQDYDDPLLETNDYGSQTTSNISEDPQHMQPTSSGACNSQSAEPGLSAKSNRQDDDNSLPEIEIYGGQATSNTRNRGTELIICPSTEVPLSSESEPFICVSSVVESGSAKTVFEAHEFESDTSISKIHLTKKDVEKEKIEVYPSLKKEFIFKPTEINDYVVNFYSDFKFEEKELDSLSEHLKFLCDVFKPRSVRKGSTMPDL